MMGIWNEEKKYPQTVQLRKWVFNELEKITDSIYIWKYFFLILLSVKETLCAVGKWFSFYLNGCGQPLGG